MRSKTNAPVTPPNAEEFPFFVFLFLHVVAWLWYFTPKEANAVETCVIGSSVIAHSPNNHLVSLGVEGHEFAAETVDMNAIMQFRALIDKLSHLDKLRR